MMRQTTIKVNGCHDCDFKCEDSIDKFICLHPDKKITLQDVTIDSDNKKFHPKCPMEEVTKEETLSLEECVKKYGFIKGVQKFNVVETLSQNTLSEIDDMFQQLCERTKCFPEADATDEEVPDTPCRVTTRDGLKESSDDT